MPIFSLGESHIFNFLKNIFDSHILSILQIKGIYQMLSIRDKGIYLVAGRGTQGHILHPQGLWVENKLETTSHTKILGILGCCTQRKASCNTNHSKKQNLIPSTITQNRLDSQQVSFYFKFLQSRWLRSHWKESCGKNYYVKPGIQCFHLP